MRTPPHTVPVCPLRFHPILLLLASSPLNPPRALRLISPRASPSAAAPQVNIGLRVLTRPIPQRLPEIYRTLGTDYAERVLPSIIQETLKSVIAQYNASQLLTMREVRGRTACPLRRSLAPHPGCWPSSGSTSPPSAAPSSMAWPAQPSCSSSRRRRRLPPPPLRHAGGQPRHPPHPDAEGALLQHCA